jgi:hypothetical protein
MGSIINNNNNILFILRKYPYVYDQCIPILLNFGVIIKVQAEMRSCKESYYKK